MRSKIIIILGLVALLVLGAGRAAHADEELIKLPTRPGVTQPFWVLTPPGSTGGERHSFHRRAGPAREPAPVMAQEQEFPHPLARQIRGGGFSRRVGRRAVRSSRRPRRRFPHLGRARQRHRRGHRLSAPEGGGAGVAHRHQPRHDFRRQHRGASQERRPRRAGIDLEHRRGDPPARPHPEQRRCRQHRRCRRSSCTTRTTPAWRARSPPCRR